MMWWHWLLLGLILIGLEMAASGGFYIIFFGVAALLIAALVLAGFGGPVWLQLLLFSVLSVASLLQKKHVLSGECATSDIAISPENKKLRQR